MSNPYDAMNVRISTLESKLQGFRSEVSLDTIDRLKTTLNNQVGLDKLITNLKSANLYRELTIDTKLPANSSISEQKLIILSQYNEFSKFLASVDNAISLMNVLDRLPGVYHEINDAVESSDLNIQKTLNEYNTRIYQPYKTGVEKCLHLLELNLAQTYEKNIFLVQAYERLDRISKG